jgi:CubicO group peptidase (beta-lactamase class C family)
VRVNLVRFLQRVDDVTPERGARLLIRSSFVVLLLIPTLGVWGAPPATIGALDRRVPELMVAAHVPGAQIAIINGSRVKTRAYGVASAKTGKRVDDTTVFEVASIGKPVFAYAVMKLVHQGKLALDKPLSSYLSAPYIADPRVKAITARMVLSHRTGFPNWRPEGKDLDIRFDPGTRFSYSSEGFIYLQRVVEHITKEPFDAFMRRMVFDPLGMKHTSYVWLPAYDAKKSWGHDDKGEVSRRRKPEQPMAASTLQTTAADLGRFVSALMASREMAAAQVRVPAHCAICVDKSDPGPPLRAIEWGLGVGLFDRRYVWHWGDNGEFKAYFFADLRTKRGAVVLTNGERGLAIAGEIAGMIIGDTAARTPLAWLDYKRVTSAESN